jgi:hypothetical protein
VKRVWIGMFVVLVAGIVVLTGCNGGGGGGSNPPMTETESQQLSAALAPLFNFDPGDDICFTTDPVDFDPESDDTLTAVWDGCAPDGYTISGASTLTIHSYNPPNSVSLTMTGDFTFSGSVAPVSSLSFNWSMTITDLDGTPQFTYSGTVTIDGTTYDGSTYSGTVPFPF